jgi:pre-mRNA cleavage complex 2 protein Pcf11
MSLYSQTLYGQSSYGGPSYSSPHPASYSQIYHQPPPAPPAYTVDAASFRREYMTRLSELTFNSRPMIQHLSMLAQDSSRFADIVAQCIEEHIRTVSHGYILNILISSCERQVVYPALH